MKVASASFLLCLLLHFLASGSEIKAEEKGGCLKMECFVERKMKMCEIGECMKACAENYRDTRFGECLSDSNCLCSVDCCL